MRTDYFHSLAGPHPRSLMPRTLRALRLRAGLAAGASHSLPRAAARAIARIAIAAVVSGTPLRADDWGPGWEQHVRSSEPALRTLVEESAQRSPSFRSLLDQINASDVV